MNLPRRKLYFYYSTGLGVFLLAPMALWFVASRSTHHGSKQPAFEKEFTVRIGVIDSHIAAIGRVEGRNAQEIKLAARMAGRIREVPVTDGEPVKKGQLVAVLENTAAQARVDEARARLAGAEAALARLMKGARVEEREARRAEMDEAQAAAENAEQNYDRMQKLFEEGGIVSQARLDQAERDRRILVSRLASARERYHLITAPPRSEDVAAARAEVSLTQASLRGARDIYDHTFVRSPVTGVVVKRFMNPGEAISFESLSRPIVTVADTSKLTVRTEIDETDIGKIEVGQKAEVTADAFPGRIFRAEVVRISGGLGKKEIHSDNPMDKVDTEILETFLELEPETPLRIGLRVDVLIQLEYKKDVLVVPILAVDQLNGHPEVRVKTLVGVESRPVRLGLDDGMFIEIVEGLAEGDTVVY